MKKLAAVTIAAASLLASGAQAASMAQNFNVTVSLNAACKVATGTGTPELNFGSYTAFQGIQTATPVSFNIECTRGLAAPQFSYDGGTTISPTSYGVVAGLNYEVTATKTGTASGSAPTAALNSIGSADVHTIQLTGSMPANQAGACAGATATDCALAVATDNRVLTIIY